MLWYRIGLGTVIAGSLLWILYLYLGGNGTLTLTYHFNGKSAAITAFQPHGRALDLERNQENGETYQRIIAEPVYFMAHLPGSYEKVRVTLEYQNPNQPVVELGVKHTSDPELFDYSMQPLENQYVDNSDWDRVENDEYVLLQRQTVYTSVEDFFASPPVDSYVGTYLTVPQPQITDPDYLPNASKIELATTLRGAHDFYFYAAAGELIDTRFAIANINYVEGVDPVTVTLDYSGNQLVTNTTETDSELTLTTTAEQTGVYHIQFAADDDILITAIQSEQERFVAGHSLHLAGSPEYLQTGVTINLEPTTVSSDGNWMTILAKHPYGVGDVVMYDGAFPVNKVDTPYTWPNPIPNREFTVTFPQNDVLLTSASYFGLPGAEAFDPWFGFRPISRYTRAQSLDYVISANYTEPTRLRSWTTASAEFDLTGVQQDRPNTLQFLLSAPGMETVPEGLKVRTITIEAIQQPITLSYLWKKLFNR